MSQSPDAETTTPDNTDPHAAYRGFVAQEEAAAANAALLRHFQARAFALALEVQARDERIAELEARQNQEHDDDRAE